jgi:RNA polymerase sigma-70 factor (ECF subfamily)
MMHYNEIFNTYYGKVRNYVTKIIGENDADDVTQEVFIKIHNNLESLKDETKLQSWIFKIAINAARDSLRKNAHYKYSIRDFDIGGVDRAYNNIIDIADTRQKSPEERVIRKEMVQCYLNYIHELPRAQYEVYVLSDIEGLTAPEIAELLSVSVDAVKMRLHRARNKLFDALKEHCRCYYTPQGELLAEQIDFS